MKEVAMWNDVLGSVIQDTLSGFREDLTRFGPRLLAMLLILVTGALVSAALHVALRLALPRLGVDAFSARSGIDDMLSRGHIGRPASQVLAVAGAWATFALFVLLAVGALDLEFARGLIGRTVDYIPQLLVAAVVLVAGTLASAFVRRSVLIAAVNAGLPSARLLASGVHIALLALVIAMALEHVGVARQVILISFSLLMGGVVLALALAFGLAGRDLAHELLARLVRPVHEEPLDPRRQL
jgi:hypothetical protein